MLLPRNGFCLLVISVLTSRLVLFLAIATALTLLLGCQTTNSTAEAEPPGAYVAMGASDTVGVGAKNPATENWAARVHAGLPEGTQFVNLGISGATLRDVLQQELPPALDARPRLVTLWAGVNDLRAQVPLPTYLQQLDTVLSQLKQVKSSADGAAPTIIVLNLPDLRRLPVFQVADQRAVDQAVRQWNAAIADVVQRHGAVLVDLYAHGPDLSAHPEYISVDGFHPSTAGYQALADLVLTTIDEHATTNSH